jgi:putative endonuclease
MKFAPTTLGRLGERIAAWFYRLRGYQIISRNLRLAAGEIDLVLRRGTTIVIAEVKTRQTRSAGEGHEAVTQDKRERLIRLGGRYAAQHPGAQLRYDILSIFWTGWWFAFTQYADAFRPVADARQPWRWRA